VKILRFQSIIIFYERLAEFQGRDLTHVTDLQGSRAHASALRLSCASFRTIFARVLGVSFHLLFLISRFSALDISVSQRSWPGHRIMVLSLGSEQHHDIQGVPS
jgi:hypothetical protein